MKDFDEIGLPKFDDKKDLTIQQQDARVKANIFRGKFIDAMILIEDRVNYCIISFFDGYKHDKIYTLFNHYWFPNEKFSLSFKVETVREIIKSEELKETEKILKFIVLLERAIKLRNIVAHQSCGYDYLEGISFTKPIVKFTGEDSPPNSTSKKWKEKVTVFKIHSNNIKIINNQINDIASVLALFGLLISTKKNSPKYNTLIDAISKICESKENIENYFTEIGLCAVT